MALSELGRKYGLAVILLLQLFGILFLMADAGTDLVGTEAESDTDYGFEFLSVLVLILCLVAGSLEVRRLLRRNREMELQLKAASGAFSQILFEHFDAWQLTASERDVAMLAIKGLGISEIAGIRNTRDGTIKAQLNAIYKKAGVKGRPQLISMFVEELMGEPLAAAAQ